MPTFVWLLIPNAAAPLLKNPYTLLMTVCAEAEKAVDSVMLAIRVPYARMASMSGHVLVVQVRFLGRSWSRRYPDPARLRSPQAMSELLSDPLKEWAVRGRATSASMLSANVGAANT
jgi:hypothetical protein